MRLYAFRSEAIPTGVIAYRSWSPQAVVIQTHAPAFFTWLETTPTAPP